MRIGISIAAIALALGYGPGAAQEAQQRITYKGIALASSLQAFRDALPPFVCVAGSCKFNREDCQGSSRGILEPAIFEAYVKRGDKCKQETSFGGALVLSGQAIFVEDRLAEVDLIAPSSHMDTLAASVSERFGPPASAIDTTIRSRAGAEFPNWIKTWRVGPDHLILELRSGRVDNGRVVIVSDERLSAKQAAQKRQATSDSKDF
jgi:hypothetical protein